MADEKITEMTVATHAGNADVFPIVQGGDNCQVTKEAFLTGAPGEGIMLQADPDEKAGMQGLDIFTIIYVQNNNATLAAKESALIQCPSPLFNNTIHLTPSGIVINAAGDAVFQIRRTDPDEGQITFGPLNELLIYGYNVVSLQLTGTNPAHWLGDPSAVHDAINRLAAVVSGGGATPIP